MEPRVDNSAASF